MLSPADFLWAVNDNLVNQLIHGGSIKFQQFRIPVGKLEETPHISNLFRLIFNFLFQRGRKSLNLRLFRFILRRKFVKTEVAPISPEQNPHKVFG